MESKEETLNRLKIAVIDGLHDGETLCNYCSHRMKTMVEQPCRECTFGDEFTLDEWE